MHATAPLDDIARFLRRLQWAALVMFAGWLLWLLAPVLTPFAIAALLAGWAIPWSTGWRHAAAAAAWRSRWCSS